MSLRARLTTIYGALLALVFFGVGIGAEIVMQGRFSEQTQAALVSSADYVFHHYGVTETPGRPIQYQLPAVPAFTAVYWELVGPDGHVLTRSTNLSPNYLAVDRTAVREALSQFETYHMVTSGGSLLEVYYTPMPRVQPTFTVKPLAVLLVAKPQSDISHALDVFNASLIGGEILIWMIAVAVTWMVTGSALRPIKAMTERASAIADKSDFSGRVPADTRAAELQKLALTFNRMLESLQRAYANQQRFLADASHELRTPLTVLQGNLHYLEEAIDAPGPDRTEALHAARLEADRMGFLVGDLLALSQADAGYTMQHEPVELDRVVVDALRRIQSRERNARPRRGIKFSVGRLDEVVVPGDSERLLQLVLILLDNAVKYTPKGGTVTVELTSGPEEATLRVSDTGVGIPPEDRDHVFDRFYRSKTARTMGDGSGLGLPIAEWIAEAHGGEISFADVPGGGTSFTVVLPLAAPPSSESAATDSGPT